MTEQSSDSNLKNRTTGSGLKVKYRGIGEGITHSGNPANNPPEIGSKDRAEVGLPESEDEEEDWDQIEARDVTKGVR